MPTVQEHSSGAVVYHERDGDLRYLLLQYGAGHWGFPKGHIEGDESKLETMAREVEEETAIGPGDQMVVEGFEEETQYYFRRGKTLVNKTVYFYLVRSTTDQVRISHEHKDFEWLPYEEAMDRVTFQDPKRILETAHRFLQG